jgi:molybdate transport repressor ModE-like protein
MTTLRVPDLDSLRLLTRIAGTGSLGKAAAEHGITQPAVTARLRSVEKLVGVPVVARGRQGSTLTPDGALLVDWAKDLLAAAEALGAGIEALQAGGRASAEGHEIAVSATTTVAEQLLPRWLARLADHRPDAAVRLAPAAPGLVVGAVLGGAAPLGFVEGPVPPDGLDGVVVARDALVVVAPPGHPWAGRAVPVGPDELSGTPLVEREPAAGPRVCFAAALAAAQPGLVPAEPLVEVTTASAALAAVRQGVGPAVLSSLAADAELAAGTVVRVPVAGVDLTRRLRAVWRRGDRPDGVARDLLRVAVRSDVWAEPVPAP